MALSLNVHFLPALIPEGALQNGIAVIIDILRASSTMTTALHNGAVKVIPCLRPEDAFLIRDQASPQSVLMGGERGGIRIAGFDFGNSPAEYHADAVQGCTIAFTTTNGTKAMLSAMSAREILVGSFLNRQAVVERLIRLRRDIHLICAGTDGFITGEDLLFAGAVVDGLLNPSSARLLSPALPDLNDSAQIARAFWQQSVIGCDEASPVALMKCIERSMEISRGGRNLLSLGYGSDLELCSQLDSVAMVPKFDPDQQCLLPAI